MSVEKAFSTYPTHLKNPNLHGKNQLGFPCSPQHFHAEIIQKMFSAESFRYAFTVVRNPFDRIISEYRFRADIAARQKTELPEFNEWLESSLIKYDLDNYLLDNHIRPQIEFLIPGIDIYKLEIGAAEILMQIQLKLPELKLKPPNIANASRSERPQLNDASIKSVQSFYAEDFERFGYETEYRLYK